MNTQDLCLGVLHLCDASGYEIKKMFEDAFQHFQNPSFGSIYPALDKLTGNGMVSVRIEEQQKRPAKKVYSITDTGREHFLATLYHTEPVETCKSDFFLLAFFAHLLDSDKFSEVLYKHEQTIKDELEQLLTLDENDQRAVGIQFTIEYGITIKKAQLKFLKKKLNDVIQIHKQQSAEHTSEQP